jgi:hypothetical protein
MRPTKLTQGDGESWRNLVATCRKVSRCAAVAGGRRNIFRDIRTQGNCGPRRELGAAGIMVTLRARLARCKGTFTRKNQARNKAGRRASRQLFGKRHWKYPECKNVITGRRNQSSRQQVHLRKERTTTNGIRVWKSGQQFLLGSGGMHMKALYEMVSVKIAKQNARSSARRWSIKEWTLWSVEG